MVQQSYFPNYSMPAEASSSQQKKRLGLPLATQGVAHQVLPGVGQGVGYFPHYPAPKVYPGANQEAMNVTKKFMAGGGQPYGGGYQPRPINTYPAMQNVGRKRPWEQRLGTLTSRYGV